MNGYDRTSQWKEKTPMGIENTHKLFARKKWRGWKELEWNDFIWSQAYLAPTWVEVLKNLQIKAKI